MPIHPVTGTDHDGLCEWCDHIMTHENLVEGKLGFYCSHACREAAEGDSYSEPQEDFHADV